MCAAPSSAIPAAWQQPLLLTYITEQKEGIPSQGEDDGVVLPSSASPPSLQGRVQERSVSSSDSQSAPSPPSSAEVPLTLFNEALELASLHRASYERVKGEPQIFSKVVATLFRYRSVPKPIPELKKVGFLQKRLQESAQSEINQFALKCHSLREIVATLNLSEQVLHNLSPYGGWWHVDEWQEMRVSLAKATIVAINHFTTGVVDPNRWLSGSFCSLSAQALRHKIPEAISDGLLDPQELAKGGEGILEGMCTVVKEISTLSVLQEGGLTSDTAEELARAVATYALFLKLLPHLMPSVEVKRGLAPCSKTLTKWRRRIASYRFLSVCNSNPKLKEYAIDQPFGTMERLEESLKSKSLSQLVQLFKELVVPYKSLTASLLELGEGSFFSDQAILLKEQPLPVEEKEGSKKISYLAVLNCTLEGVIALLQAGTPGPYMEWSTHFEGEKGKATILMKEYGMHRDVNALYGMYDTLCFELNRAVPEARVRARSSCGC